MREKIINSNNIEWKDAEGYPTGTQIKILREEGSARTFLLKLPPGFDMKPHSHIATEQHFVLEGEYESEDKIFGPGFYRLIPGNTNHGPFLSKNGAIILVIWDPI